MGVRTQLIQKLSTSRRLVLDALKTSSASASGGALASKLAGISALFERLHCVIQSNHTLLRDTLSHVSYSRLRSDLYCVGWGVKLYSLTHLT